MAKRLNSRQKGARGERYVADMMTEGGLPTQRAARLGVKGGEDIVCGLLRGIVHIECKFTETIGLGTKELDDAIQQATDAAPEGSKPCVIWKNSRKPVCLSWDEQGLVFTVAGVDQVLSWLRGRRLLWLGRQLITDAVGKEARAGQ